MVIKLVIIVLFTNLPIKFTIVLDNSLKSKS